MPYHVTVYNTAIAGLFKPGGDAWDETKKITREIHVLAIDYTPKRSGVLAAGNKRSVRTTGIYGSSGSIRNDVSYAPYVHEGTTGPIYPKSHTFLKIPAPTTNGGFVYRRSVRGQAANPWITKAARTVLSRYGVHVS